MSGTLFTDQPLGNVFRGADIRNKCSPVSCRQVARTLGRKLDIFVGPKRNWDLELSSGWMLSRQLISALTGFDVAHYYDHLPLSNSAFIVCLIGHTAVQTSVGFLAVEATLFHMLMPTETSRNVNLYNASMMRLSTFVHDLMTLQAPEEAAVQVRPLSFRRETSAHWYWPQKSVRVRTLKMEMSVSWLSVGRKTLAHSVDPGGPYTRDQAERLVSMSSPWKPGFF